MTKIYDKQGDSFIILHNQKTFEVVMKAEQFEIKRALCDDLKEFIFVINAFTDIAEELSLSPQELAEITKQREKRQKKSQNIIKEKKPRTFLRSKMTDEEKKEKKKLSNQKRKEQLASMSPEEKAKFLEKRQAYMKEYKERKKQEALGKC